MADVMTPEQRSRCMSRIRGADTGPELRLRRALWAADLRYRIKPKPSGKPDLFFPGEKVAVFVDGCFWHGCPEHGVWPKTNAEFWKGKIERTMERDREVTTKLDSDGWVVLRFWEHDVNGDVDGVVDGIARFIALRRRKRANG